MTDTSQIGAFGFAIALTVHALLTLLLLSGWRRRDQSLAPALATAMSVLWGGVWVAGHLDLTRALTIVTVAEWARGLAWLIAVFALLQETGRGRLRDALRSSYSILVVIVAGLPVAYLIMRGGEPSMPFAWLWIGIASRRPPASVAVAKSAVAVSKRGSDGLGLMAGSI